MGCGKSRAQDVEGPIIVNKINQSNNDRVNTEDQQSQKRNIDNARADQQQDKQKTNNETENTKQPIKTSLSIKKQQSIRNSKGKTPSNQAQLQDVTQFDLSIPNNDIDTNQVNKINNDRYINIHKKIKNLYTAVIKGETDNITEINLNFVNLREQNAIYLSGILQFFVINLKSLRLWKARLGPEGIRQIASGLNHLYNLQSLSLEDNNIGALGIALLCTCFPNMRSLNQLFLHNNNIGALGAKILGENVGQLGNLNHLTLDENSIGSDGLADIMHSVSNIPNIQGLSLAHNNVVGATNYLASVLPKMTQLRMLILRGNGFTLKDQERLMEATPWLEIGF